jgi:hypothetical protein
LYGYTISGDLWHSLFESALGDIGFRPCCGEHSLYEHLGFLDEIEISGIIEVCGGDLNAKESAMKLLGREVITGVLSAFVDDGTCTGTDEVMKKVRTMVEYMFELKMWLLNSDDADEGQRMLSFWYSIKHGEQSFVFVNSSEYDQHNLLRFWELVDRAGINVPARLRQVATPAFEESVYREQSGVLAAFGAQIVGGLSYSAYSIRVDAQYACNQLAQHLNSWNVFDDKMSLRVHAYIESTMGTKEVAHVSILDFLNGGFEMLVDSDASFAGCRSLKSVVGLVISIIGKHGSRFRIATSSKQWPQICPSSGHAEIAAQVPGTKIAFGLHPLVDHLLFFHLKPTMSGSWSSDDVQDVLPMRFRSDASVAVSCIQQGYSKQMQYLKSTRQFNINLSFLHEVIGKLLEKASTLFIGGDSMTKALPPATLKYHRECNLMLAPPGSTHRCKCLCSSPLHGRNAEKCRCTRMIPQEVEFCEGCIGEECVCPCWEGHAPPKGGKDKEELECVQVKQFYLRRRKRQQLGATTRSVANQSMLRTPFAHPKLARKRTRVDSGTQYPAIDSPSTPPAVGEGFEVVSVAVPKLKWHNLRVLGKCFGVFKKNWVKRDRAIQRQEFQAEQISTMMTGVAFPLESKEDLRELFEGLKRQGIPYVAMSRFWGVPVHWISEIHQGTIAGQKEVRGTNLLIEAVNKRYHEALEAAMSDGGSDDSLQRV